MEALVADVLPALCTLQDRPLILFGHSMGALIAFEVARALSDIGRAPAHLFVSGCRAPHVTRAGELELHKLPNDKLVEQILALEGTPKELFSDPSMTSYLLPILRADLEVVETYPRTPRAPIACNLTAMGGGADPDVSYDELAAWSGYSEAEFQLRMFSGGHFFIRDEEAQVLEVLKEALARHRCGLAYDNEVTIGE